MTTVIVTTLLVIEYALKVIALGTIPENRRSASSQAWLLLILFLPALGFPLFLLIGSPYVAGRRQRIQLAANRAVRVGMVDRPTVPSNVTVPDDLVSLTELNRRLAAFPVLAGRATTFHPDYEESIAAIVAAVDRAETFVHVQMYIIALDSTTQPLFDAFANAVRRGVVVRVLYDHLGSRAYPGYRAMKKRLTDDGVLWHRMMPIDPLHGRWRRPDLRNHRKLVVIDGDSGFMGSQNVIDSSYLSRRNRKTGRHWIDLNVELAGEIVLALESVFSIDWYTETGEILPPTEPKGVPGRSSAMQLVPSGPGFPSEPNLRLFTSMIGEAQKHIDIVSPYFVPEESLLAAITTAAFRGVKVTLFVSQKADQFMVHHAQRSYYTTLLQSGVRIYTYPDPATLHTKFMVVDDRMAVIGSSNMDMRSFALDYEISLFGFGSDLISGLKRVAETYRETCAELTEAEWAKRHWFQRYLDNVMRLTSAVQ
jgi:cardiolipin synthase A/B